MTFQEFVEETKGDLKAFEAWWMTKHAEEPSHFPLEMGAGDWFEQFLFFVGTEKK